MKTLYESILDDEDVLMNISKENDKLIIAIQDFASGMSKEVQDNLFKKMVTTKGKNGTGLGLFMSYSTIKGHFLHDKRHDQNTHIMYFTQFDTIIFLDYIYRNASIYLDRKYNLYLFFQNGRRSLEEFNV